MSGRRIQRSALVAYSARQIYDLVNDVACYPEFLSGCVCGVVTGNWPECYAAKLTFTLGGMRESWITQNETKAARHVNMKLLDGPFRRLEGCWQFRDLGGEGCRVSLDLDYDIAPILLPFEIGFAAFTNKLVDAFCKRARLVYG